MRKEMSKFFHIKFIISEEGDLKLMQRFSRDGSFSSGGVQLPAHFPPFVFIMSCLAAAACIRGRQCAAVRGRAGGVRVCGTRVMYHSCSVPLICLAPQG